MIILASASPRRKMLLESAGVQVKIEAADIDESHHQNEDPREYARRMALEKAQAVAKHHLGENSMVVAADTSVVLGTEILGKPANKTDAYRMLKELSGKAHYVMTGVCLIDMHTGKENVFLSETAVHFTELSDAQINWYIETGEPMDKAGAYGIQGGAAGFVSHIEGSYTNVVGLPLCETLEALRRFHAIE